MLARAQRQLQLELNQVQVHHRLRRPVILQLHLRSSAPHQHLLLQQVLHQQAQMYLIQSPCQAQAPALSRMLTLPLMLVMMVLHRQVWLASIQPAVMVHLLQVLPHTQ